MGWIAGKHVVMTGATNGIGLAAAEELAMRGARLTIVARDQSKAKALANRTGADVVLADLSSKTAVRRAADEILERHDRIDALINNAGVYLTTRQMTKDWIETTWAVNHLAPFLLTNLLLERLRAAAGARIVSTASAAHRRARLAFDRLQEQKGMTGYGTTKLCNILFTRELARRIAGTGVTANCLHPGFVATRFGDSSGGAMRAGIAIAKRLFALSPEEGAKTMIHLASSPQVAGRSGGYYDRCAPAEPSRAAQSDLVARRLWELSAAITGIGG